MTTLLRRIWRRAVNKASGSAPSPPPERVRPDTIDLIGPDDDTNGENTAVLTLVIGSVPRTGSYELCRLLVAGGVAIFHEHFHPQYPQTAASRWGMSDDPAPRG